MQLYMCTYIYTYRHIYSQNINIGINRDKYLNKEKNKIQQNP